MNYNLERMKLGFQKMLNSKTLFLILALSSLLLFIGFQALTTLLPLTLFPMAFLPIAKILWACITLCGFMGLLVLIGTPRNAVRYERALSKVLTKTASSSSNNSTPPAILASVEKTECGLILEFLSDSLSIDDYKEHQSKLEVALNLNIIEICKGKGVRHVLIKALPGDYKQPHIIPWDDSYLSHEDFTLVLGQTPFGLESINLAITPHLYYGGASGSGKSQLLKLSIYQSVLLGAEVYLIDLKGGLDFPAFFHRNCTIITDRQQFLTLLEKIEPKPGDRGEKYSSEIERRREKLLSVQARDIAEYNRQKSDSPLPRIIIAVDEIAEALDKTGLTKEEKEQISKIEGALSAIARQGRAFGVHLILATQRGSADLIPGQIRSNLEYRVCGRADKILSQIILDNNDAAEKIPPDSQGLFCTNMGGTLFKAFYLDDDQLE